MTSVTFDGDLKSYPVLVGKKRKVNRDFSVRPCSRFRCVLAAPRVGEGWESEYNLRGGGMQLLRPCTLSVIPAKSHPLLFPSSTHAVHTDNCSGDDILRRVAHIRAPFWVVDDLDIWFPIFDSHCFVGTWNECLIPEIKSLSCKPYHYQGFQAVQQHVVKLFIQCLKYKISAILFSTSHFVHLSESAVKIFSQIITQLPMLIADPPCSLSESRNCVMWTNWYDGLYCALTVLSHNF